ncbi:MAG: hypothetical protein ACKV2Q_16365 [Planctomycetaceae bacterium]
MTQIAESVLESVLKLAKEDRQEIADRVCESLWNEELEPDDLLAWQSMIEERLAECDRGEFVTGTPYEVIEQVRRELAEGKL